MKKNILLTVALAAAAFFFGVQTAAAQLTIKVPKIPKKEKPKPETPAGRDDAKTENGTGRVTDERPPNAPTSSNRLYYNQRPTDKPVLLKNSIYVLAKIQDEYWKAPGQRDYSSWVPLIRFSQFYNNERDLNYRVEYFKPDGTLWYSERLEQGNKAADGTVMFQSPSPYDGIFDTKSTDATGTFSFKITDEDANQTIYQGKFKVGKFSRAGRPQEKNKNGFFVEHDWMAPFGIIGFSYSDLEIGGILPQISFYLNGLISASDLEGRLFYKDRQIASTRDKANGSGVTDNDQRDAEYAAAFAPQHIWRRWSFQFGNFRVDNNGPFNRDYYPNAHYADKNPGDYTVKVYYKGTLVREMNFTVGPDGRFVVPAYSDQIPLPYYQIVLPVKTVAPTDKFNAAAWKTDAFYGNPLNGFSAP
jgi:hypothetical protein